MSLLSLQIQNVRQTVETLFGILGNRILIWFNAKRLFSVFEIDKYSLRWLVALPLLAPIWSFISIFYNNLFGIGSLMRTQYPNNEFLLLFNCIFKWRVDLDRNLHFWNQFVSVTAGGIQWWFVNLVVRKWFVNQWWFVNPIVRKSR